MGTCRRTVCRARSGSGGCPTATRRHEPMACSPISKRVWKRSRRRGADRLPHSNPFCRRPRPIRRAAHPAAELIKIDLEYRWCRVAGTEQLSWKHMRGSRNSARSRSSRRARPRRICRPALVGRRSAAEYVPRFGRGEKYDASRRGRSRAGREASAERFHQAHAETLPTRPRCSPAGQSSPMCCATALLTAAQLQSLDALAGNFPTSNAWQSNCSHKAP